MVKFGTQSHTAVSDVMADLQGRASRRICGGSCWSRQAQGLVGSNQIKYINMCWWSTCMPLGRNASVRLSDCTPDWSPSLWPIFHNSVS